MAKQAQPTYKIDWYTPANIRQELKKNPAAVRKEYTRLRDIEQKRIKRMAGTEWEDTEVYRKNAGQYPKLADLKSDVDLVYKLSDLSRFVRAKTSTISGLKERRAQALETLYEHGYEFVTEENYNSFGKFMEEYRTQHYDEMYPSGDAADSYYLTEIHQIEPEQLFKDFKFWLDRENIDIALSMKPSRGKSKGSARRLRERITRSKQRKRKRK